MIFGGEMYLEFVVRVLGDDFLLFGWLFFLFDFFNEYILKGKKFKLILLYFLKLKYR